MKQPGMPRRASASIKPAAAGKGLSIMRTHSHNAKPTDKPAHGKPAHMAVPRGHSKGKH